MSLMAFSVLRTSLVRPKYLCAALNVTRENRVNITSAMSVYRCSALNECIPWTMWPVALGNFFVSLLKASAGITAKVVSSLARATTPSCSCVARLYPTPDRGSDAVVSSSSGIGDIGEVNMGRGGGVSRGLPDACTVDVVEETEERRRRGIDCSKFKCDTSVSGRENEELREEGKDAESEREYASFCQLICTSSVKRPRMVNKLDNVPPLPTSFSS